MTTRQRIRQLLIGYHPGKHVLEQIERKYPLPRNQYLILRMMEATERQAAARPITDRIH